MFIYHIDLYKIMPIDLQTLVASAEKIGHKDVPVGGGNNSEVVEALSAIFAEYPGKFFKSTELTKVLVNNGVNVTKIGNTLFAMKNARKCSQVKKGVYISYSAEYDGNITEPAKGSDDSSESAGSESSD